jgi:hypothetical protein
MRRHVRKSDSVDDIFVMLLRAEINRRHDQSGLHRRSSNRTRGAKNAAVILFTAHHLDRPVRGRAGRHAGPRQSQGATRDSTMTDAIRTLMQFNSYRPELHYMRGPGPKWHARHATDEAKLGVSVSVKRAESMMLQTFKNWPNKPVAAICAGVLSVLFLLSIATSLIASSSSSVNAEPPGKGCVVVSKGEYQGAYRKKLLLTRFGRYVRAGRLGRYYYWYCR